MIKVTNLDIYLIISCFFLLAANLSLVFAIEQKVPKPDVDFFLESVLPACEFYDAIGQKPLTADCSEWYMTDGYDLVVQYMIDH